MNLYGRFFWILFRALWERVRVEPGHPCRTSFLVWPQDLDLNLHLNNGRYLTVMDLGRLDFMGKTGTLWGALRRGWLPVLGATQMVFRRPLKPFQRYQVETTLEYWDDKWFVMRQHFIADGQLFATGRVRGLFRSRGSNVSPAEVLKLSSWAGVQTPPLSPDLKLWLDSLEPLVEDMR